MTPAPSLPLAPLRITTGDIITDRALRIAYGNLASAIWPVQAGLLAEPRPVIAAGAHYPGQWTRDASVNAWNAGSLLAPAAAGDGLRAVVERSATGYRLPHPDYYDAVVWLTGCRAHAEITGDRAFAAMALAAARDLLAAWEREEFDPALGLFRGGSFFNDGISAYPERYARPTGHWGNVRDFIAGPGRHPVGGGLPMHTLSTNALYVLGYQSALALATMCGEAADPGWAGKAEALRAAVRRHFLDQTTGRLRYLVDSMGSDDRQEIAGWAFARLAGIITPEEGRRLASQLERLPHGIPCLWPTYERYAQRGGLGRHSGLVWPQVIALWGEACARDGDVSGLAAAIHDLSTAFDRIGNATECWHPLSGAPDGGLQEFDGLIQPYPQGSCHVTTWGATGLFRLLLRGVAGVCEAWDHLALRPCLPVGFGPVRIDCLPWRGLLLDIELSGAGSHIRSASVDGVPVSVLRFAASEVGSRRVCVELAGD